MLVSVSQKMKFIPRPLIFIKVVITEDRCQIFGFERGVGMGMIDHCPKKNELQPKSTEQSYRQNWEQEDIMGQSQTFHSPDTFSGPWLCDTTVNNRDLQTNGRNKDIHC